MQKNLNSEKPSSVVGVDLGHKTWQACRFDAAGEHRFISGTMDERGISRLCRWLQDGDKVAIETGTASFWFKRKLEEKRQCRVLILNAVDLKLISGSLKKTDKEDALKLARLAASFPEEDLPLVRTPDEDSEILRKLVSERRAVVRTMVTVKARFYGLCVQAGFTAVKKKELRTAQNMTEALTHLPSRWHIFGQRLIEQLKSHEAQLAEIEKECKTALETCRAQADILTSMPGIGTVTALTLIAYTQNFSAFHSAGAVSYYAGLVPRLDHSGTIERNGHIIQRANTYLRSLLVQAAWSLVRSRQENAIKVFYHRQSLRIGSGKAIVATARKMLETLYVMSRTNSAFRPA